MTAHEDEQDIEQVDPGRARRGKRTVFAVAGVVLLGLGAAGGLLLGRYEFPAASPIAGPNPVDIGFAEDMTVHHQQAITMAQMVEDRGGPQVRPLARQIEHSQLQQVGQLQAWLGLWGAPLLSAHPMTWMSDGGAAPQPMGGMHMGGGASTEQADLPMPGLATQDELAQLQSSNGKDLDVLFMQLMLRHHQGGLPMAQYAAEHAELAPVKSLAATMAIDESQEIAYMTVMLGQNGATPLPAPPPMH